MDPTYSSVTKFFLDLKAHLLANGCSLARTVVPDIDVVLDTGSGFVRLQKKTVSPTVVAVGWEFGTDADLLVVSDADPERFLPFTVSPGAEFVPTFHWYEPTKLVTLHVISSPDLFRRYRVESSFAEARSSVFHCDRYNPQYEPNFKDTGGPYLSAGA